MGPDRSRLACDARAVAMTAARLHGHSLPQIAAHFDRDHTAVLHATRRIDKTPPLKALAASIADQLPQDPATNGQDQPSLGGAQAVQAIERYSPPEPHPREDNHMKPLPRASTRALRQAAAGYGPLPALLLTVLLSGACGTDAESAEPALTSGDKQICYAAIRRDAMAVLSNTGSGDTDALVEIAAAVVVGSSEEEDELTMQRVETFCRDHGYNLEIPVRDQIGH